MPDNKTEREPQAKAKPKQASGSARIKASGKIPFLLALTPEERAWIEKGAKLDSRNLSQFLTYHAVAAARKLEKENNSA